MPYNNLQSYLPQKCEHGCSTMVEEQIHTSSPLFIMAFHLTSLGSMTLHIQQM